MENDLIHRLFNYATSTLKFSKTLSINPEIQVIRYQLIKSSTSPGANYEEAQAGSSKADFISKTRIALREMRESNYWLKILKSTEKDYDPNQLDTLINESKELKTFLVQLSKRHQQVKIKKSEKDNIPTHFCLLPLYFCLSHVSPRNIYINRLPNPINFNAKLAFSRDSYQGSL